MWKPLPSIAVFGSLRTHPPVERLNGSSGIYGGGVSPQLGRIGINLMIGEDRHGGAHRNLHFESKRQA